MINRCRFEMPRTPATALIRFAVVLASIMSIGGPAEARQLSLIRDAEIEHTIRGYATPLFGAAGLDTRSVRIHIVNDSGLNAFVAGGQNIFIFTGLLMASDTANQIIGVLAHETGHIAGGHLARTRDALRGASAQAILAIVLGAAATVAGQAQVGAAIISGGPEFARRSLLRYSRTQEAAADQAAVTYLNRSGQSARGMLEVIEKLGDQESLLARSQDPYVRSHPLTRERIALLRDRVAKSRYGNVPDPPDIAEAHRRMKAKLKGFLQSPGQTLLQFPPSKADLASRYARAIAHHKLGDLEQALVEIDALIALRPDDPYFHELKGQILLEHGRPADAIPVLERSVALAPDAPLLHILLAQAQIASEQPAHNRAAISQLVEALSRDRSNALGWLHLAIAYGRDGQFGMSALANAERNMLIGRKADAQHQADLAERKLPHGSPGWVRAQDLKRAAQATKAK